MGWGAMLPDRGVLSGFDDPVPELRFVRIVS
jgi:hypothetical protein